MASLDDAAVQQLLQAPNHAVVSTLNEDGSIHSTVVWVDTVDGQVAINSAVGRKWPTNLENDPAVAVLVYDEKNPYEYVEARGKAGSRAAGAEEDIGRLAKKYLGKDEYPFLQPGEQRVTFLI